jgi:predicted AlkP superfamily phosphohydrolase/phosphomutase
MNKDLIEGYILADELLDDLLNYFHPENLIICSDHGFRKYNKWWYGWHDCEGFYLINSENFVDKDKKRSILEIAPIILKILNIENKLGANRDSDNKTHELSQKEKNEIMKKLGGLGYV